MRTRHKSLCDWAPEKGESGGGELGEDEGNVENVKAWSAAEDDDAKEEEDTEEEREGELE